MSLALSPWLDWDAPEPRWQRLSVLLGHLDRAEAAAAEGDLGAAAHFLGLAEAQMHEAMVLAATANLLPEDGVVRLREIAWRLADGGPGPARGYAIEFRCAEHGGPVTVWLTLGRVGPETGALLGQRDGG